MALDVNIIKMEHSLAFSMGVSAFNSSGTAQLLANTPLTELSLETRNKLSEMLNGRKILRHDGHDRDWRGLAELAKVRNFCNSNHDDPMQTVLTQWCLRNATEATCLHLLHFLSKIDRWDVSDDILTFLVKDAEEFANSRPHSTSVRDTASDNSYASENEYVDDDETDADTANNGHAVNHHSSAPQPPVTPKLESLIERIDILTKTNAPITVSLPPSPPRRHALLVNVEPEPEPMLHEINPLTRQDAARLRNGLPLTKYDAFVLYADPDQQYANEMQQKLDEYVEFNFELVFKNRDLLGGTFFHDAVTELIEDRCRYLLLIVTKNFSRDFESYFFFNNAQTLQLKENRRRIIPLLYDFPLPRALRGLHTLKYHSEHFWDLLADSLSVQIAPPLTKVTQSNDAILKLPPPESPADVDEQKSQSKLNDVQSAEKNSFLRKPAKELVKALRKKVQK